MAATAAAVNSNTENFDMYSIYLLLLTSYEELVPA
jgi:hypothetical protein